MTEFEQTSTRKFPQAVALAKTQPGFIQLMDERNILIYRNIYQAHELLEFQALYPHIKHWKGAKLYLKGDAVTFDAIESGVRCYIETRLVEQGRPISATCAIFDPGQLDAFPLSGCLGCRRSEVSMAWQPAPGAAFPGWYMFGRLDRQNVYHLNHEDLENAVIGHLIEYQYCPLLNLDQVTALIRRLPERIDPRQDPEWQYQPSQPMEPQRGRYRTPAIAPVSAEAYRAYLKRTSPPAPSPNGEGEAETRSAFSPSLFGEGAGGEVAA